MDAYYGLNSANGREWRNGQVVEAEGIIETSGVVVVGTSQRERRIRITSSRNGDFHAAGESGVFLDSAISPPILTSCSSHTAACNAFGATNGITSLTTTCTLTTTTCTL